HSGGTDVVLSEFHAAVETRGWPAQSARATVYYCDRDRESDSFSTSTWPFVTSINGGFIICQSYQDLTWEPPRLVAVSPIWPGFIANVTLYGTAVLALSSIFKWSQRRRR